MKMFCSAVVGFLPDTDREQKFHAVVEAAHDNYCHDQMNVFDEFSPQDVRK